MTWFLSCNNGASRHTPSTRAFTKEEWAATLKLLIGTGQGGIDSRKTLLDPNTTEGILRFFTQGHAANILTFSEEEQCYICDYATFEAAPVRSGYKRYGGCVHITQDLEKVIKIVYLGKDYTPDDPEFIGVAHIARATDIFYQSAVPHSLHLHLTITNWTTLASREVLPAVHPIRRLLSPFTVLGSQISYFANQIIMDAGGVIDRVSAIDTTQYDVAEKVFMLGMKSLHWETFPDELKRRGLAQQAQDGHYYYGHDGLQYWNTLKNELVVPYVDMFYQDDEAVKNDEVLQKFFKTLRDLWTPATKHAAKPLPQEHATQEALVDWLTHHIFQVSGFHEQIHTADYLMQGDVMQASLADRLGTNLNLIHCGKFSGMEVAHCVAGAGIR